MGPELAHPPYQNQSYNNLDKNGKSCFFIFDEHWDVLLLIHLTILGWFNGNPNFFEHSETHDIDTI